MKGLIFIIVSSFFLPLALAAQDASMTLDTYLAASKEAVQDVTAYERATPSFVLPLGTKVELTGNGYIEGAASSGDLTPPFTYGLKELRLEVMLKDPVQGMSAFVFDAGRMGFSDPSGLILSSRRMDSPSRSNIPDSGPPSGPHIPVFSSSRIPMLPFPCRSPTRPDFRLAPISSARRAFSSKPTSTSPRSSIKDSHSPSSARTISIPRTSSLPTAASVSPRTWAAGSIRSTSS